VAGTRVGLHPGKIDSKKRWKNNFFCKPESINSLSLQSALFSADKKN